MQDCKTYKYVVGMQNKLMPISDMLRSTRNFQSSDVIERSVVVSSTKMVLKFMMSEAIAANEYKLIRTICQGQNSTTSKSSTVNFKCFWFWFNKASFMFKFKAKFNVSLMVDWLKNKLVKFSMIILFWLNKLINPEVWVLTLSLQTIVNDGWDV